MNPIFFGLPARMACLFATASLGLSALHATDWPQFMGSNGDLTTPDEPPGTAGGLQVKWRLSLPCVLEQGTFSSMALAQGRVVTLTTRGCQAFDAVSGQALWTRTNMAVHQHSTPAISAGRVYMYDSVATLCCLDLSDGKVIWWQATSNHVTGYQVPDYSSVSPLVSGNRVFVWANSQTNCVLAFDASNGALIWKGLNCRMGNASPILTTFGGVPQVLCKTSGGMVSVSPENGSLLWTLGTYGVETTAVPAGQYLFDAQMGRVSSVACVDGTWQLNQLWMNYELASTWTLPVVKNGYVYGLCGPGGYGKKSLTCLRLSDGAVQWRTNGFDRGSLILAGSKLVALAEKGTVSIVNPTPEKYECLTQIQPLTNNCFNLPVVANGRIYVRNEQAIACLGDVVIPQAITGEMIRKYPAGYSLMIRTADHSPLDAQRAARIGVRTSGALNTNLTSWVNFLWPRTVANGVIVYSNLPPPNRFFKIVETNSP